MTTAQTFITKNLLQLCYHCDDAGFCVKPEQYMACWTENGVWDAEDNEGARETRTLLQAYYE